MSEKTSPLPWSIERPNSFEIILRAPNKDIAMYEEGLSSRMELVERHLTPLIAAANNYPKLESLNMELVEDLEKTVRLFDELFERWKLDEHESLVIRKRNIEALIQKAKGGA